MAEYILVRIRESYNSNIQHYNYISGRDIFLVHYHLYGYPESYVKYHLDKKNILYYDVQLKKITPEISLMRLCTLDEFLLYLEMNKNPNPIHNFSYQKEPHNNSNKGESMLTSITNNQSHSQSKPYPKLMRNKTFGYIILATKEENLLIEGTYVSDPANTKSWPLGCYISNWDKNSFEDWSGTVNLIQQ